MSRAEALALRREQKFEQHAIRVVQEHHTELRSHTRKNEEGKPEKYDVPYEFDFAVYAGKQLVGRTRTRRSALKRAHQEAKKRSR